MATFRPIRQALRQRGRGLAGAERGECLGSVGVVDRFDVGGFEEGCEETFEGLGTADDAWRAAGARAFWSSGTLSLSHDS